MSENIMGRPLGSASKYPVGHVFAGAKVLEVRSKVSNSGINNPYEIELECQCGNVFATHYPNFVYALNYTNVFTCGCQSSNGGVPPYQSTDTEKMLRALAEECELTYLENLVKVDLTKNIRKVMKKFIKEAELRYEADVAKAVAEATKNMKPEAKSSNKEAISLINVILMSRHGLNPANTETLRRAREML